MNRNIPSKGFAVFQRIIWFIDLFLSKCDENCEDDKNFEVFLAIALSILVPKFSASAIRSGRQLHHLKAVCTLIEVKHI
jgi:hypothetical protein